MRGPSPPAPMSPTGCVRRQLTTRAWVCAALIPLIASVVGVGGADMNLRPASAASLQSQSQFVLNNNNNNNNAADPTPGPFRKWLSMLRFTVPDIMIVVNSTAAHGEVGITNLTCGNITLGLLKSAAPTSPPGLSLNLTALGLACSTGLNFSLKVPVLPKITAALTADITVRPAELNYTVLLPPGSDGLPTRAECSDAYFYAGVPANGVTLHFDEKFAFRKQVEKILEKAIADEIPKQLGSLVQTELKTLTDVNLTAALKVLATALGPRLEPLPLPAPAVPPPGTLNLVNDLPLLILNDVLANVLGPSGKFSINRIVDKLTNGTGELNTTFHNLTIDLPVGQAGHPALGNIELAILKVDLGGLDTWEALELIEAAGPVDAVSHTNMTDFRADITVSINVTTANGPVSSIPLFEQFTFGMNFHKADLLAMTEIALNTSQLQLKGVGMLADPDCIFTAVENLSTVFFQLGMTSQELELIGGSSGLEADIDDAINNVLKLVFGAYSIAVPAVLNEVLSDPFMTLFNNLSATAVDNATCSNASVPAGGGLLAGPPNEPDVPLDLVLAIFAAAVVVCGVFGFLALDSEKSDGEPGSASYRRLRDEAPDVALLMLGAGSPSGDPGKHSTVIHAGSSLLRHPEISWFVRTMVMAGIVMTAALFAAVSNCIGAKVYITLTIGDDEFRPPSLFDFGLVNTVRDMWDAEVYPLSIIVAVFSGAWPQLKCVLMGVCWCTPVRHLSLERREFIMMLLDALGKWSLIDSYLMTLFLVAFKFDISGTVPGRTPGSGFPADGNVQVLPLFGYYGFIGATFLTLVMSHIILYYQRKVTQPAISASSSEQDEMESVSSHVYRRKGRNMAFNCCGRITVALALLLAINLVLAGVFITSFSFDFKGAAGLALGDSAVRDFSVISLSNALSTSAVSAGPIALRSIQVMFLCFAVIFPLGQLVTMLFLWLVPMRLTPQTNLFHAAEVLNAWAALDVFVFGLIASILEISQFAQFIVGDKCDEINVLLKKYANSLLDGDDKCFDVQTTLGAGCWILFGAAVIQSLLGGAVLKLCHTAIGQRRSAATWSTSINAKGDGDSEATDCCTSMFVVAFPFLMREEGQLA